MTDTLVAMTPPNNEKKQRKDQAQPSVEERAFARQIVTQARASGVSLTGRDGLLQVLTKAVIETALDEEMNEHLGYDKHAAQGRNKGNSRNGTRTKTVLSDAVGPVEIDVPRDRDSTFEPVIVKKLPTPPVRYR